MTKAKHKKGTFILHFVVVIALCAGISAQIRPVYDQGALGLMQQVRRLNTTASALMIGAHPDDEDTALLAYLARGESARTAYLSLTRGDGGQNIIGPELGEALGVIRTEELLQARKLDGAEQFFTRAYDYGFSKTLAEAKSKWDEKVILCDVVSVIRHFRPLVVISQFTGTPVDGHGQHQFAGYISPIAVNAAADAGQCADAGSPWQVKKFYVRHRGTGEPTLRINTGRYDRLLGRSYFEIAMHARSQHRSQEQGVLELKGDQFSSLKLVSGPEPRPEKETGIFEGIVVEREAVPNSLDAGWSIPILIERLPESTEALLSALGTRIDVLADRETVVQGEAFPVAVRVFAPPLANAIVVKEIRFSFPQTKIAESQAAGSGPFRRETANFAEFNNLTAPATAETQPYWLRLPRTGDMFSVPGFTAVGEPHGYADLTVEFDGKTMRVRRPIEYRFADDIRGEIRRNLNIVPKLSVAFDRELVIVSKAAKIANRDVIVNLTNNSSAAIDGKLRLKAPIGWTISPAEADFRMSRKGENSSIKFSVSIPTTTPAGSYLLTAEASSGGQTFSKSMQTVTYEHIQTHRIYRPARSDVKLIDLKTTPVKVAYIRGSGDRVPEAIKQLGLDVEELDDKMITAGDLSRFDTIVVGIRAYQVRPDIVANNQRLLDFAKAGGTLIVQYQLPPTYSQANLTPFPTQMGPRVSDENAPVTILQPTHPVFNFPNKITDEDFRGWVQERNLYNFSNMDPKYVGLLESHDTSEAENKGGLVIADIGKGKYIYCSYSLFRQLPAGVPGAYRLLANLVSLPKARR